MHNPRFDYFSPATLGDACKKLAELQGRAVVLAGGTDLMPRMKQRLVEPEVLISLQQLSELNYIEEKPEFLEIGALTPLRDVERNAAVKKLLPALSKAARLIAGPVHRSMGTIGGNICLENRCPYYNQSSVWRKSVKPCFKTGGDLCHVAKASKRCHAIYAADLAPVLLLSGASFIVTDGQVEKVIPCSQFFVDDGLKANTLAQSQLLSKIRVPIPDNRTAFEYIKERPRESVDFPVVGAAAQVKDYEESISVKLAFTGVASYPFEAVATGFKKPFDKKQVLEQVGRLAYDSVRPVSRAGGSAIYKKELARVLASDGVNACFEALNI
ncbi:MAG: hypothetical protein GX949_04845 [Peptococcaceae bacterium]|jgi:4-hydroxybenzoyl-CoA reductase subunit beta|nr:hypothetical protein [Peptococcaceae bacterium]